MFGEQAATGCHVASSRNKLFRVAPAPRTASLKAQATAGSDSDISTAPRGRREFGRNRTIPQLTCSSHRVRWKPEATKSVQNHPESHAGNTHIPSSFQSFFELSICEYQAVHSHVWYKQMKVFVLMIRNNKTFKGNLNISQHFSQLFGKKVIETLLSFQQQD